LPIKRSAYKELRKAKLRHFKNVSTRTELKTIAKKFQKLIETKKLDEAKKSIPALISKIDKAASKGILKSNTASRKISRLMKKLAQVSKASKA
jgi:small subunit ribosomal protein S20